MARRASAQRLDTSVSDARTVQKAQRLMSVLNTGNADLYRGALDVFDWCVRQVQEGRHIGAIDESGHMTRQLVTPLLEAARDHGRITLHSDAFDQIVQVLERPAEPTRALRELMADAYAIQASTGADAPVSRPHAKQARRRT